MHIFGCGRSIVIRYHCDDCRHCCRYLCCRRHRRSIICGCCLRRLELRHFLCMCPFRQCHHHHHHILVECGASSMHVYTRAHSPPRWRRRHVSKWKPCASAWLKHPPTSAKQCQCRTQPCQFGFSLSHAVISACQSFLIITERI